MKTYTGNIEALTPDQIFVFGSNTQGRHGKGAAKTAFEKFGAIYGRSRGLQGQCYAICTKDISVRPHESLDKHLIHVQIQMLYDHAVEFPHKQFLIPYKADSVNLNMYTPEEMAELFARHPKIPKNIIFEHGFATLVIRQLVKK